MVFMETVVEVWPPPHPLIIPEIGETEIVKSNGQDDMVNVKNASLLTSSETAKTLSA